ncbi:AAA family ATPase [Vibrio campbellii]|uniref:TniB family NTP-binding protein n=1 Tax=Vibrio campbellii TaxID=680 RepID=UPI00026C4749|nr:TniB family NTP-binding protein [Vibrio campbellii]AXB33587.1 AAA family ATPase [Vibrio campbellii]
MTEMKLKTESEQFSEGVCEHLAFEDAQEAIQRLHRYQNQVKGMLLVGEHGCGKSFFCQDYTRQHAIAPTPELTPVPVLYVEIQNGTKAGGLLSTLLEGLGDPAPFRGGNAVKGSRLLKLLKELKVSMIIIDEAHEMLPSKARNESPQILGTIKWLMNSSRIPLVLCGHIQALDILHLNKQLMSRMQSIITFNPFNCLNEDSQLDFADYMNAQFEMLPRKVHSNYNCLETNAAGEIQLSENTNGLLRLCLATQGIPLHINDLLIQVIEQTSADMTVNKQHFADAWNKVLISSYGVGNNPPNPFTTDIQCVKRHLRNLQLYPKTMEMN